VTSCPAPAKPTLGIIGFGAFGQLAANHLRPQFAIHVADTSPALMAADGITVTDLEGACTCDIVILAVPVSELEALCSDIAPLLRPGTLVMDVGSVKVEPARIMARALPRYVDLLASHPMFGPQSIRAGTRGLKLVLCPLRTNRAGRVAAFLRKEFGLRIIVASPEEHDREAAVTQGITHLIAKILLRLEEPRRITTRSFDLLWEAVSMVRHDAAGVSSAIESRNPFSAEARLAFFREIDLVRRELAATQTRREAMPVRQGLPLCVRALANDAPQEVIP